MLSILIPTYNFDITNLVKALHQQCKTNGISFEILCFDDGSQAIYKSKNQVIASLENVTYQELPSNLGRAKIRNVLGKAAKSSHYITNYIDQISPDTLLYGGRVYKDSPPENSAKRLHYFHGKHREEIATEEREKNPYHSFMTNNFLIPKDL